MNGNMFEEVEKKLSVELLQFKEEVIQQSKEQIYEQAYKIMAMQYIYDLLIELLYDLTNMELGYLLLQKDILERIYYEWMKDSSVEENDLNVCIKNFVTQSEKENQYGKVS